jgi:hypothetical protein
MSIHEPANYNLESAYVLSIKITRIAYVPPEPAESSLHPPSNCFQIHFNIIISPTPHYSKRFLLRFPTHSMCAFLLSPIRATFSAISSRIWSPPRTTYVIFNVFFATHKGLNGTLVVQLATKLWLSFPFICPASRATKLSPELHDQCGGHNQQCSSMMRHTTLCAPFMNILGVGL